MEWCYIYYGIYTFTTTNAVGCDSTSLTLTMVQHHQTACDSFDWNGVTYTESGTYTFTTTNAFVILQSTSMRSGNNIYALLHIEFNN